MWPLLIYLDYGGMQGERSGEARHGMHAGAASRGEVGALATVNAVGAIGDSAPDEIAAPEAERG